MPLRNLGILALVCLLFAACSKPTPESELKKFESHQAAASRLKSAWPGFSNYLDEELKQGEAAFKAAQEANDLEAMRAVNQSSMPLLAKLEKCDSRIKSCESNISKMRKLKLGKRSHEKRVIEAAKLDNQLLEISQTLQSAQPESLEDASAVAEAQSGLLLTLQNKCSSAYRKYNKTTKSKKKKKKKKK